MDAQRHVMILEKTDSDGGEDWLCPTCGRRFRVNWEPRFRRKVLEVGDEYAVHSGGKGGLQMGAGKAAPVDKTLAEEGIGAAIDEPGLTPWMKWLDQVGFEDLWKS